MRRAAASVGASVLAHLGLAVAAIYLVGLTAVPVAPPAPVRSRGVAGNRVMRVAVLGRGGDSAAGGASASGRGNSGSTRRESTPLAASAARAQAPSSPPTALEQLSTADVSAATLSLPPVRPLAPEGGSGSAEAADGVAGNEAKGGDGSAAASGFEGVGSAASETGAPGGRGDADQLGLAMLHARLAESASRCYPAAAQRFRLKGTAQVRFCVEAGGESRAVTLLASAGASMLDGAARECVVQQAAPFPSAVRPGCYEVPVRFGQ